MVGHCSKCHKVWKLKTEQGVCQWCGQMGICQTTKTQALRSIKSSRRQRQRQALAHGNGYDQLQGEWLTYYEVASKFNHKAKVEYREDLLQDIILTLASVASNNGHKPFTLPMMYRIASVSVANYWRGHYQLTNGLDCRWCSKAQKRSCKEDNLYSRCPRAVRLESLSKPIVDSEGNTTELGELVADDKAIDLDEWLDTKRFLLGCPQRLIAIANKLTDGEALSSYDRLYLCRYRKKQQQRLPI
jgi:hypothetical protein